MKPYYQHNNITIFHADARECIDSVNGDVLFTDPPYGVELSEKRPQKMQKHQGTTYTFGLDSEEYVQKVCIPIVEAFISKTKRAVLTPGIRCAWLYPRPFTIWAIYWPNGAGIGRWGSFTCWSPVLCYGEPPGRKGTYPDVFVTTEQAKVNGHPCPKPLALWKRVLSSIAKKDEVILDCFMGSGTTLRAAKDMGYAATGIEIDERYCEIAALRLSQEVLNFEQGS